MNTDRAQIDAWLRDASEGQHLEFKEAKTQYDFGKLLKYCVALGNEGGGKLVLGVSDRVPREVVGTVAYPDLQDLQRKLLSKLHIRIDVEEVSYETRRLLVFHVPGRPLNGALSVDGCYWMRCGEDLVAMTDERLRAIHLEGTSDWLELEAMRVPSSSEVTALLDTQTYFDLLQQPYPTQQDSVLARLANDKLIVRSSTSWSITNMAALLLAKRLDAFPESIARKATRVIVYEGRNKLSTKVDRVGNKGYACGFEGLIDYLYDAAPGNHFIEESLRVEAKMVPRQAIRELVANAMVHQDFAVSGAGMMVEIYSDRIEISNPGTPAIAVERFIDEFRSRNERFASLMRRLGICEEKGSGIDKVVSAAEVNQLPAPDFRIGEVRTTSILFAQQEFSEMSKADRLRACYQHCCLMYVGNQKMTNQSLRERFQLAESKSATVSQIISGALETGQIRLDDSESVSRRYAKYIPFWA